MTDLSGTGMLSVKRASKYTLSDEPWCEFRVAEFDIESELIVTDQADIEIGQNA